ncbi:hypothetical protein MHZ92_19915 [Sporosarcina sp. ACRSL]|uniref:hypothetical protein n=1 Tax=Sporosarcina sp. ACRSL TaxID=2918215 RepID=UPI001EF3F67E|nr:hypothetical protein [Sporosarcina sp. ACRSL]MCG7346375.1 hypothetical protein [Sporosarcina sp. ACRSL]
MTFQGKIIQMVANMSDSESKELLARIFLKLDRINNYDYPKTKAHDEIYEIYREEVVGRMIFDKEG